MAKLDKTQQTYAMDRVEQMARKATDALKPEKQDPAVVVAALEKAGFIVTDKYYISGVKIKPTAKQEQERTKIDARKKEIRSLADQAKDQIMLGDSDEVTKILTDLVTKFGE